jgi:D-methionine transport system permease protein
MADFFASNAWQEILKVFLDMKNGFVPGIWETLYSTVLSTLFAYVIGLPLGVLLVTGERNGIHPLPAGLMKAINVIVNLLRSVPFLILMIMVLPLSKVVLGTSIGTPASIIPLVIAAFPFVARMVESSIREVDKGVIEAAQAMGASTFQIIWKVMIPESMPSLISGGTISLTTILGYGAMAGIIGGGGLGKIAINYGYYRYNYPVMVVAVILLIILVQIFQSVGTHLAVKNDKRITQRIKRRRKK